MTDAIQPVSFDEDSYYQDPVGFFAYLAWRTGDTALRRFVAGLGTAEPAGTVEPVVWPEHLDVAITLDEVNYGVSPGDAYLPEPYAYVGPHRPRSGAFWNAPFGAARPVPRPPAVAPLLELFQRGHDLAAADHG